MYGGVEEYMWDLETFDLKIHMIIDRNEKIVFGLSL